MSQSPQLILDSEGITQAVSRVADLIYADVKDAPSVALVGIHTRGVPFAERVGKILEARGLRFEMGRMDVLLYRDDFNLQNNIAQIKGTEIPFDIDGAEIVLFDEVLYTGRTVRAAIDSLMDYGRPSRIRFAVLVDRGHRELPIQADYVGLTLKTTPEDYVDVRFHETDDAEEVWLTDKQN